MLIALGRLRGYLSILFLLFSIPGLMPVPPWPGDEPGPAPTPAPEPALILPDLHTLPPYDLRLIIDRSNERKFIRFSNSIWNSGPGTLEFHGDRTNADQVSVSQIIYTTDGHTVELETGRFIYHKGHDHWHWEGFSLYEIWSLTSAGEPGELLVSSDKVSYCLRDNERIGDFHLDDALSQGSGFRKNAKFTVCGWAFQGISPGWVDTYLANTPGQFVEITSLEDGIYALKSTVDPDHIIQEADPTNNSAITYFSLENNRLQVLASPFPDTSSSQK